MKRRAFFLTSFLAPVVAFFKPALKPSVAENELAFPKEFGWYGYDNPTIGNEGINFDGGNDLQDSLIYEVPKVYRIKVYRDGRLISDTEVPETVKFLML